MMELDCGEDQKETLASLELLYHISREIAKTIHLPSLIERILVLSIANIKAQNGSIFVVDENRNIMTHSLIINGKVSQTTPKAMQTILKKGLAGWVLGNHQAVLIEDTSIDRRWLQRPDDDQDATGPKSAISVPFLARDQVVGVITLVHPQTGFFSADHQALIQAIANQSAIAVLNARFHADTLRKAQVMTALAESAEAITGSLNLEEVLRRILEQISLVFETEAVSLALVDEGLDSLTFSASTSEGDFSPVGESLPIGVGIAGWVAEHKTGIIVPDTYQDDRFIPDFDQQTGFKTEVVACVPIFSEGEVIGIVEAINPKIGRFESEALQVLQGISSLAGTAIRHARLYETLQETHKRYYDLFESNISGIVLTDPLGKIQEVNQQIATLSRYSKDELLGMMIEDIHQVDHQLLHKKYQSLSKGKTVSYETNLVTREDKTIPVTIDAKQVTLRRNTYLQWDFHDDTERKALDQLREDLLSMIYHDLRSPLANVISSLDVLTSLMVLEREGEEIQSLFQIASRSTKRIQRLTASLLDINRLEAGQSLSDLIPIRIETILDDCLEELKPILDHKKIRLEKQLNENLPIIKVNVDMIQRVMINLLENAVKYTPSQGRINLSMNAADQEIRVSIIDGGPGIPKSHLQDIFEKFMRLPGAANRKGYGLGLAFCRLAVIAHGGKIWAENSQEGGACFTFTLPL